VLHISIRWGLEVYFGEAKPTKAPPDCGKTSVCFLMQLTRKSLLRLRDMSS